jgi:hypothetical protein
MTIPGSTPFSFTRESAARGHGVWDISGPRRASPVPERQFVAITRAIAT